MSTETPAQRYRAIETWDDGEILLALFEAQLAAAAAIGPALPAIAGAVAAAVPRIRSGGRLIYAGAGSSGRLAAQDAAELFPTFGFPLERTVRLLAGGDTALARPVEAAEDDAEAGARALEALGPAPADVVVAVAASGRTPFTLAVLRRARAAGTLTLGVAADAAAPLAAEAEFALVLPTGAEPIAGSTRMKAGTAQKIALNLFSTLLMIRLGHVHDGQMVDMRPTNAKLRARALRMLRRMTGAAEAEAQVALDRAGGNVKRAVLLLRGCPAEEIDARLDAAEGRLGAALAALEVRPS